MSGMKKATSLSEWQLQAVLYKSKLTQYYETFISQGGDDIDQIMQCDEQEFLEIMSLVGMSQKPLHVRRLQRTLNEFSLNRAQFLLSTVNFIGLPPMDFPSSSSSSTVESLTAALQFLIPGFMPNQLDLSSLMASSQLDETLVASTSKGNVVTPSPSTSTVKAVCSSNSSSAVGGTANILPFPDSVLMSLVSVGCSNQVPPCLDSSPLKLSADPLSPAQDHKINSQTPCSSEMILSNSNEFGLVASSSSSMSSAAMDPSTMIYQLFEMPSLCDTDIRQLAESARLLTEQLPRVEPRLVHNKKKISKELLDAMSLAIEHPRRLVEFRRFSAIYGRFDAKRKADKPLTFHEALVNEAAAQLCICRPELLTRRDELFPLARKLVRSAGFRGLRGISHRHLSRRRKRKSISMVAEDVAYDSAERSSERSQSPGHSSVGSTSPSPSPLVGGQIAEGMDSNGEMSRPISAESTSSRAGHKPITENRSTGIEERLLQLQAPLKKRREHQQQQQSPKTTRSQE